MHFSVESMSVAFLIICWMHSFNCTHAHMFAMCAKWADRQGTMYTFCTKEKRCTLVKTFKWSLHWNKFLEKVETSETKYAQCAQCALHISDRWLSMMSVKVDNYVKQQHMRVGYLTDANVRVQSFFGVVNVWFRSFNSHPPWISRWQYCDWRNSAN